MLITPLLNWKKPFVNHCSLRSKNNVTKISNTVEFAKIFEKILDQVLAHPSATIDFNGSQ